MSNKKKDAAPQPGGETAADTPKPAEAAAAAPEETKTVPAPEKAGAELEAARAELAKAKTELAAEKDKYLRLLAEYDNYRKRSARERESIYGDVKADTLEKLLPVYDNLERALKQETADEAYRKGVEMTMNQFTDALGKLGVTPIETVGKPFDPALHNAVMHTESGEHGEGVIVQEFRKGFRMGDRVIRFSMVQVAN